MTAKQIKNLNDLLTLTLVKGFSAEIAITKYHKRKHPYGFIARLRSNMENEAPFTDEFEGTTPLEAYSKLADQMMAKGVL